MIFLVFCVALLLMCVAFLYYGLVRTRGCDPRNNAKILYAQRVEELQEDIQSGDIVADLAQAATDDIVRVSLDDEKHVHQRNGKNAPLIPSLFAVITVVIAISSASYWHLGDVDRALGRATTPPSNVPMDETSIRQAIANLKENLKTQPDNAEAWALLGRTMMAIGNYPEALNALKKANELVPDAPSLMLQYADALAMNAGGELTPEAQQLVARVLEIDPNNIAALWLAGLGAAEKQDTKQAITYLTQARALSAEAGASTIELAQVLARLNADSSSPEADNNLAPLQSPASELPPPIHITVNIDPKYSTRLNGEEILYVFARVAGQSGPPVAVQRINNASFPLHTTLDQSMSMAPQFRLTSGQSIVVAARLSKSGQAMPQAGDLIGQAPPFDYPSDNPTQDSPLTLIIDSTQH